MTPRFLAWAAGWMMVLRETRRSRFGGKDGDSFSVLFLMIRLLFERASASSVAGRILSGLVRCWHDARCSGA